MTTLDIDRLSARYHDVDPARLPMFDEALRELADHVLDDELAADDLADALASAWAVCIDEVVVAVDLDPSRSTVARSWASAILEAITRAVDGAGAAAGAGVDRAGVNRAGVNRAGVDRAVVYRREVDALIDLVTGVARADLSRLWAWRQVRLVGPRVLTPTPGDVAAAAVARPSLIPAVLAAAGSACRVIFGVEDWIRLAHAVASLVGSPPWSAPDAEPGHHTALRAPGSASPAASIHRMSVRRIEWPEHVGAWATVPAQVWAAVAEGADRWSLAVLCQAVTGPHAARDRSAIAAIVDAAPAPHDRNRPATPASDTRESSTSPDEFERFDADVVTSAWGGVWFLVHAFLALDVVEGLGAGPVAAREVPDALTAIVVAVTGAPADDPSVSGLCGRVGATGAWGPTPEQEQEVEHWAAAIAAWLGELADGRLAARLVEPWAGSLWRRTVTIDISLGRIDITSPLADVDIGIRIAGLDIDPGFVWWLGAVVGFRYV